MDTSKPFINLKALSLKLDTLTVESGAHIDAIEILCNNILREIDTIKIDSVSEYVIMTKIQAKAYINKAKVEIGKYNNKIILRSDGNFIDILKPAQAGLETILTLEY